MAFGSAFTIWVDRIKAGRFEDTNDLFVAPEAYDVRVSADGSAEAWVEHIVNVLKPIFDPKAPTALFLGCFQPFHDGHRALIKEGIHRVGQACVAVQDGFGINEENHFHFQYIKSRIEAALVDYGGRFVVGNVANFADISNGCEVGCAAERSDLAPELYAISASD